MKFKNVILGLGLSGLSFYDKLENKDDSLSIEQNVELGGYSRTIKIANYRFDYTGHFLHLKYFNNPSSIGSLGKNFECDWKKVCKKSKVLIDGSYCEAPYQYNFGELGEKHANLAIDSFKKRNLIENDASLESFFKLNFGDFMCEKFFIPYNQKLYGVDLKQLSKKQISRFFPKPNESVILNQLEAKDDNLTTYNSLFWYPINGGIDKLLLHFEHPTNLEYAYPTSIDLLSKTIYLSNRKEVRFEKLITSIPLDNLIKIIKKNINLPDIFLEASKQYAVHIGTKQIISDFKDVSWIYIPDPKVNIYRIGNYSSASELMSGSKKGMSLYIEMSSNSNDPINEAINYLTSKFSMLKNEIEVVSLNELDPGYVHFKKNQSSELNNLKNILKNYSVFTIGRYGNWDYVSMEDCILEAQKLAEDF